MFLKEQFEDNSSTKYFLKEIEKERVQIAQTEGKLKVFTPIRGSAKFHVILFEPTVKLHVSSK